VPVGELIDAAYHIVHGLAWEKQIDIRVSIEPERIMVNVDERCVKQVLHNLLSNAINASPQGEEITIQARKTSQEAAISIIDHGPGIPAEYHEKIFEEFAQYNNGAQSSPSGGLGLPVSRNLVEGRRKSRSVGPRRLTPLLLASRQLTGRACQLNHSAQIAICRVKLR